MPGFSLMPMASPECLADDGLMVGDTHNPVEAAEAGNPERPHSALFYTAQMPDASLVLGVGWRAPLTAPFPAIPCVLSPLHVGHTLESARYQWVHLPQVPTVTVFWESLSSLDLYSGACLTYQAPATPTSPAPVHLQNVPSEVHTSFLCKDPSF